MEIAHPYDIVLQAETPGEQPGEQPRKQEAPWLQVTAAAKFPYAARGGVGTLGTCGSIGCATGTLGTLGTIGTYIQPVGGPVG